jgi:nicotinamide-nucleotide amidase
VPADIRTAEIVAVGSELLTPHRLDTNSLYLTGRLNDLGVKVHAKAVVRDDRGELAAWIRLALTRADLVITTGGLGPTDDDITREAVTDALGLTMREDGATLQAIRERFRARGLEMPAINVRQAMVPEGAVVLSNPRGSAPGLWIDAGRRAVVLLPGPPRELQPMFDHDVAPRLSGRTPPVALRRRVIKITGRSESHVDEIAQPIYTRLGDADVQVDTSILAAPGQIEIHLEGRGTDAHRIDAVLTAGVEKLASALAPYVFSDDGRTLEAVVGDELKARGWRIAVAESCTAGLALGRLTEVAGSSAWVAGGIVAYANEVKTDQLGVPAALLDEHGAVSEPVAQAMASGVRERLHADVGVAITGIAGPDGGSPAKPVGTVVVALSGPRELVKTLRFAGDRQMVRAQSVAAALDMVRRAALSRG